MKNAVRTLLSVTLALVVALPLMADDKEKKAPQRQKPEAGAAILKRLDRVGLTAEQTAKIKDLAAKAQAKTAARPQLSEEQRAKLTAARKAGEIKDMHKLLESVLTAEQKKALEEARAAQGGLMKHVFALLTDEQKAKLAPVKSADRKALAEKRAAEMKKHAEARKAEAEKRKAAAAKHAAEAKKRDAKKPAPKKEQATKKPCCEKAKAAGKACPVCTAKKAAGMKPCCEKAKAAGKACPVCAAKKEKKKD